MLMFLPPLDDLSAMRNAIVVAMLLLIGGIGAIIISIFYLILTNQNHISAATLARQKALTAALIVQALLPLCCVGIPLVLVAVTTFLYDETESGFKFIASCFSPVPTGANHLVDPCAMQRAAYRRAHSTISSTCPHTLGCLSQVCSLA